MIKVLTVKYTYDSISIKHKFFDVKAYYTHLFV